MEEYVSNYLRITFKKKKVVDSQIMKSCRTALEEKQVYQYGVKYNRYLFERFENYGTMETKMCLYTS